MYGMCPSKIGISLVHCCRIHNNIHIPFPLNLWVIPCKGSPKIETLSHPVWRQGHGNQLPVPWKRGVPGTVALRWKSIRNTIRLDLDPRALLMKWDPNALHTEFQQLLFLCCTVVLWSFGFNHVHSCSTYAYIWGGSWNRGTPKSCIWIVNYKQSVLGDPPFMETPIQTRSCRLIPSAFVHPNLLGAMARIPESSRASPTSIPRPSRQGSEPPSFREPYRTMPIIPYYPYYTYAWSVPTIPPYTVKVGMAQNHLLWFPVLSHTALYSGIERTEY